MRKRIWGSRRMVQRGEVLGEKPVPLPLSSLQNSQEFDVDRPDPDRLNHGAACTKYSFVAFCAKAKGVSEWIHVYGRHKGTSCTASVWFHLVRNSLKISHIRLIWNCVHKPWSCWLRHWTTRWKVAGSIPDRVTWIFYWFNPSGYIMALVSTQPLTDMSTRDISRGLKAAGA